MAEKPKSVRLRHVVSGAVVEVREDKAMGSEWEPVAEKKAPAKSAAPKSSK